MYYDLANGIAKTENTNDHEYFIFLKAFIRILGASAPLTLATIITFHTSHMSNVQIPMQDDSRSTP